MDAHAAGYLAGASAAAIAAGFALNDSWDIREDRVNNPWRPVARGLLSAKDAVRTYKILSLTGLLCAVLSGSALGLGVAVLMLTAITAYSTWIKRVWFLKNVFVAATVTLLPVIAVGSCGMRTMSRLVAILFVWSFQKEILADIRDVQGDMGSGVLTLPVKIGGVASTALVVTSNVVLWVLILSSWSPTDYAPWVALIGVTHTSFLACLIGIAGGPGAKTYLRAQVAIVLSIVLAAAFALLPEFT